SNCIPLNFNNDNSSRWEGPFMGTDDTVAYIPDYYAVYYYFVVKELQDIYIQINGEYGNARYMSYNIYDASTLSNTGDGSILDNEINPYCDSYNPYSTVDNGNSTNYNVNIVSNSLGIENELMFPQDIDSLVVMLRYYVPEDSNGEIAGVELPSIVGKKTDMSGEIDLNFAQIQNPDTGPLAAKLTIMAEVVSTLTDSIGFWKLDSSGLLANKDNEYLIGPAICSEDQLAIIKFKPPTYNTANDITQSKDVRYWSLNIGDRQTFTYNGIKDEDAIIADDGWCYIVFGRPNNEVESKCAIRNYNYVEWNVPSDIGVIIYRNMLGNSLFEGWLGNVLPLTLNPLEQGTVLEYLAPNFINDYGPRGIRVNVTDFLID
ncbi:MAG: hypothetical protein HN879_01950, partial [Flavobacteriaceae bacterium]|nr:hypothetical protein [Flavobacteriaceae bacterium]